MRARICLMICSTSTLSERTEKSDMATFFDGFPAIAAPRLPRAAAEEFGRFCDAGAEDTERAHERLAARQRQLRGGVADLRIAVRVGRQLFPIAEQVAPRAVEHLAH